MKMSKPMSMMMFAMCMIMLGMLAMQWMSNNAE